MKIKTKLTRETSIKATLEIPIEFDTETGEAEVVGDGRVVQHEEVRRRRFIQAAEDPDMLDMDVYARLVDEGKVEIPEPGGVVMLTGEAYVLDPDWELPEDPTGDEVVEMLVRKSNRRRRQLKVAKRRVVDVS